MVKFFRFLRCEAGATSLEYGLIAAVVSLGIVVGVVNGLGLENAAKYDAVMAYFR